MAAAPGMKVIYHVEHGASPLMHVIDANHALNQFPDEWSEEPWPEVEKEPSQVEIPDGWIESGHAKVRALARKLGAPPTVKIKDAEKIIETELAHRAKAAAEKADAESKKAKKPDTGF